jgi:hypothetical protein
VLAAALFAGAPRGVSAQCSMCKTALTNSPEGQAMAEQMNNGILIMMAAPYLVFGTVGAVVFRSRLSGLVRRRGRRDADPSEAVAPRR